MPSSNAPLSSYFPPSVRGESEAGIGIDDLPSVGSPRRESLAARTPTPRKRGRTPLPPAAQHAAAAESPRQSNRQSLPHRRPIPSPRALTNGVPDAEMSRVWDGVTEWIGNMLASRRAVVLPKLGQFTFKRVDIDEGTWGEKHEVTPVFVMHPGFSAQYRLKAVKHVPNSCLRGQIQTLTLNSISIALDLGVTREVVNDCVKEAVRRFGAQSLDRSVSLDFGFCRISSQQGRYVVTWCDEFMKQVRSLESTKNHREVTKVQTIRAKESHNPYDPYNMSMKRGDIQRTRMGEAIFPDFAPIDPPAGGFSAPAPEGDPYSGSNRRMEPPPPAPPMRQPVTPQVAPPQTPYTSDVYYQPHPPQGTKGRPESARRANENGGGHPSSGRAKSARQPGARGGIVPTKSSALEDDSPFWDPSRGDPTGVEWSPFPGKAIIRNVVPFQKEEQESPRMGVSQQTDPEYGDDFTQTFDSEYYTSENPDNAWVKRKRAKAKFRAKRKKAYKESWDEQIAFREKEKDEQLAKDKKLAAEYMQWANEEQRKEQLRNQEIHEQEREAQLANEKMVAERGQYILPRKQPMGHIFEGWTAIKPHPHDLKFLKNQVESKEKVHAEEKRKAAEQERRLGEQAIKLHKEQTLMERSMKKKTQAEVAAGYDEQIAQLHDGQLRPGRYNNSDDGGGNIFFHNRTARELAEDERQEINDRRTRLLETNRRNMEEDLKLKEERKHEVEVEHEEERKTVDVARVQYQEEQAAKKEEIRNIKAENRRIWEAHAQQKKDEERQEIEENRKYKPPRRRYWRNESSEDEA